MSMSMRQKLMFISIFFLIFFIPFSVIRVAAFQNSIGSLVWGPLAQGKDTDNGLKDIDIDIDNDGLSDSYEQIMERGILFLKSRQSPKEPQPEDWPGDLHAGEFATYKWNCPDMNDREYVFTLFTTPFVIHSLNATKDLPIASTPEFENMILLAVSHFAPHEENIGGHYGIYRFFGYNGLGEFAPPHLPPDFCTTGSINAALHESGRSTRADLDFFKGNYRTPDGIFYVWLLDPAGPTDICSGTVANALYMYASLGEEDKIPEVMTWLNDMLDRMISGLPYLAEYYRSPYAFTYLTTRIYADTGAKNLFDAEMIETLQAFILAGQETAGNWPPYYPAGKEVDLETALAVISLLNLGYDTLSSPHKSRLDAGVQYLLNNQNSDGSWDCAPFYMGAPQVLYYGSEELTTAFCLEALAKYAKVLKGEMRGRAGLYVPLPHR